MQKFTKEQVLTEAKAVQDGTLDSNGSEVHEAWQDMADNWLADDPHYYSKNGFEPFDERTPEQIVVDFHLNDRLDPPLSEEEFNKFLDAAKSKK